MCVFVCLCDRKRGNNIHTRMQKLASVLVYTLLFEHRISPPVLLVPCGAACDQS